MFPIKILLNFGLATFFPLKIYPEIYMLLKVFNNKQTINKK